LCIYAVDALRVVQLQEVSPVSKIVHISRLRVVLLPLVGVAGTLLALVWPVGHAAFCAGLGTYGA
jgi:hypothetical protein